MLAQLLLAELQVGSQHEGEEQLMLFEQGPTDILIERVSEVVDEVDESHFQLLSREGVLNCELEEIGEPLQGVLVHWVNS